MDARDTRMNFALALLLAAIPVFLAATAGNLATLPNIPIWYAGLVKPAFNPPNWVFGPAWGLLYALMILAFARVLRAPPPLADKAAAIIAFLVQIVLNGFWSVAFFAWHSPLAGLVTIVALIVAIIATIAAFRPLDRLAAWMLAPYLAWVSFATALNASIWWLNP